jgi:hypothetical protein
LSYQNTQLKFVEGVLMRFAAKVRGLLKAAVIFPVIAIVAVAVFLMVAKNSEKTSKRQWNLNDQFAAKKSFVAFPVPLRNEIGLVWIDRPTHSRKLIRIDGASLQSPYISDDGQRLLFVKIDSSHSSEVVRCEISDWQCASLFKLDEDIQSPIEIGSGNLLLAASKLTVRPDGRNRYDTYYFYHFDSSTGTLENLPDLSLLSVTALMYVKPKVYFDAYVPADSDFGIYSRQFDENSKRFSGAPFREGMNASERIRRSSRLACSERCRLMAFLNLSSGWHLMISASEGIPQTVTTDALGISRPSIVGDDVIVNELFDSEYKITAYRLGGGKEVLERLSNSPERLEALEHIRLSF